MNRLLEAAARAFADRVTGQQQEPPNDRALILTVTATAPALTVEWGLNPNCPAKRCASFTPAVGDLVLCEVVRNQLVVVDRIV